MDKINIFGYNLKELFPYLVRVGFLIGLIIGAYLLINY